MEISRSDVLQILKIVDETEHLAEVELVLDGVRLHIQRYPAENGSSGAASSQVDALSPRVEPRDAPDPTRSASQGRAKHEREAPLIQEGLHAIRAPMLGTFYRSPAPGEPPFVQVGQRVKPDDTVATIEVMKLFNSISAGVNGVVERILPNDASLVEYGEVLLLVKAD